jgi:hypothetical protein
MYSENRIKDAFLVARAMVTNQVARFAPKLYMRLLKETGRGSAEEGAEGVARYFLACFNEYLVHCGLAGKPCRQFLQGKRVLEYGPGDMLGVALLMYAHGAKSVDCVDRFSLRKTSELSLEVYRRILDLLIGEEKDRGNRAFREFGRPESGFAPEAIRYFVTRDGLTTGNGKYDLVLSRAVLEHVNNLEMTMVNISHSLSRDGLSIHKVDLKSHGLDRYRKLDFLTWPEFLYQIMYSHKGFPNRWRINTYRELVARNGLWIREMKPTETLPLEEVNVIHSFVARRFSGISREDLSWLGFWMVLAHDAGARRI